MWVPFTQSISFYILTSLILPSLGGNYPFILLVYIWCTVLTCSFLSFFRKWAPFFFSCRILFPVSSLLCFSALQILFTKLQSFISKVLLFFWFYHNLPMFFQTCIPGDDTHHTMIGTFPLYPSIFFNIQISDNSYSGPGLLFLHLPIPSECRSCFGSGIFSIHIF